MRWRVARAGMTLRWPSTYSLFRPETGEQFWAERLAIGGADGADAVNIVRLMGFLVQRRVFEIESARSLRGRPDNPDVDGRPDPRLCAVQHAAKPAEA